MDDFFDIGFILQSLGCVLYAMCYFKSPFDAAYERGDSVALAVMSRNVDFPPNSIYDQVIVSFTKLRLCLEF